MALFTPDVSASQVLRNGFDSGIGNGQTVTILDDPDFGGFRVTATGVQVDPVDPNTTGVGQFAVRAGDQTIRVTNNGQITLVNADGSSSTIGNVNSSGLIAPVTLANGATVGTSMQIDGPNGQQAERIVITNGEYKVTAALRSPHPDSASYFDMNFEELTNDAADNATGHRVAVPGTGQSFGIPDLLRIEPTS
jgi:hypothetical protein